MTEQTLPPEELARYADAIVDSCLHLAPGDLFLVRSNPEHRELVVALADAAYRRGVRHVESMLVDPRLQASRVRHAEDEEALGQTAPWYPLGRPEFREPTTASIRIDGVQDPSVFDGLPSDRLQRELLGLRQADRRFLRSGMDGHRRGTVVVWPTRAWAGLVYPDLDNAAARTALARDLLTFCRLGPDDPAGTKGWDAHTERLTERGRALTAAGLTRLELRGPGTTLDLGLAPGQRWLGGPRTTTHGAQVTPNFPTEENFTSPLAPTVEGTFRCTRPLVHRGRLVEGIRGEFRKGRLIRLEADDAEARDFLAAQLDIDNGARRIGEIALVDASSRIGQTGRVYYNTLLDENAAAHFAFGAAYSQTRPPETGRAGLNRSAIHLDVMIGTDDLEATGVRADGSRVPLIADGAWQLP